MSKFTLTLLDTARIQDYIFSSNRLQENIGASELVYRATTLWAFEALEEAGITRHNIELLRAQDPKDNNLVVVGWKFTGLHMEDDADAQAEVIQAAGGNALILFRESESETTPHANAVRFSKKLTFRILREAPGLNVLVKHIPFDFENDKLPSKYDKEGKPLEGYKGKRRELEEAMSEHKRSRLIPAPTLGLSVTAACSSTGLPAVRTPMGKQKIGDYEFELLVLGQDEQESERTRLISRETTLKLAARELANKRLRYILGDVAQGYDFPADIDNLGRISGNESYVAIIHADGNGMGSRVQSIENATYEKHETADRKTLNREYIKELREFSQGLEKACRIALTNVVRKITDSIDTKNKVAGKIPVIKKGNHNYIPFRPLVFGGDDVTFLCNGQLGVELATRYLEEFEKQTNGYHACAGIGIVKMHYPFSRAYKLAEELTHSAKELVKSSESDFSALDWHFAQSGLSGSLTAIRDREYMSDDGKKKLYIRPLTLKEGVDKNTRSWDEVNKALQAFNEEPWSESHNKVIGLREPLRKNGDAVKQYRLNFGLEKLPEFTEAAETGWFSDRCAYFDIIELLDHHVFLEPAPAPVKAGES